MERDPDAAELEDFELAFARLAWVQTSSCLQLPSQREAMEWLQACCDDALAALEQHTNACDRP